jgi:hypothetical protein
VRRAGGFVLRKYIFTHLSGSFFTLRDQKNKRYSLTGSDQQAGGTRRRHQPRPTLITSFLRLGVMCARALHLPSSHTHALWGLGFTEALLLEQLDKLLIAVPVEVYPLHLLVAVVEDDQVRVVMVNPLDIQVLVILPLLVVFEERSKLDVGRVIQASARAALKASLGPARSATTTSQQMGCARAHTHTHTHTGSREAGLRRLQTRVTHHLALPLLGPAVRPSRSYEAVRRSRSLCLLRTDPNRSKRHHPAKASDGAQLLCAL